MKLELKHLAPYLPYRLKCKWNQSKPFELKGLQHGSDSVNNEMWIWKDKTYFIGYLYECKPILRPLSDLNKKIQKAEFYMSFYDHLERINPSTYKTQNCALMLDGTIEMQYYNDYQFLFENHFDVFGLIEKGLAIDINKIN